MSKTWIYHKTKEPMVINDDDMEEYHAEGWRDSPAPFLDIKDFGITADDKMAVQQLGDTVQGVCDNLNGALNIGKMKTLELEEYAKTHYNVDVNPSGKRGAKRVRAEVQALVDGKSD